MSEKKIKLKLALKDIGIKDISKYSSSFDKIENMEIQNISDIYDFALQEVLKQKNAFFSGGKTSEYPKYDLSLWSKLTKEIYSLYFSGTNYEEAVEKVSEKLTQEDERTKFLKWLKYYNEGNAENYKMKKEAGFNLSLVGTDAYTGDRDYFDNSAQDFNSMVNEAKEKVETRDRYKGWKKKFHTAWRRMDKILKESEDFIEPEKYEEISNLLHTLDVQIGKIRLKTTASDLLFNFSNKLEKLGFYYGCDELRKIGSEWQSPLIKTGQQIPGQAPVQTPPVAAPTQQPPQQIAPVQPNAAEVAAENKKQEKKQNMATGEEALKNIAPVPGPRPEEYSAINMDKIGIDDAAKKIEIVAGMLVDRRIIRHLAEFDIMLDKIGIAAMFPELTEAQSRLIDAYGYALVRVTKMLGMLANNRANLDPSVKQSVGVAPEEGMSDPNSENQKEEITSPQENPPAQPQPKL